MIEKVIDINNISNYEPSLVKLLNESKLNSIIEEAQSSLVHALKNEGKMIRDYCVPFVLAQGNNNQPINSDWTEDTIERTVFVVDINNPNNCNVELKGADDVLGNNQKTLKQLTFNSTNKSINFLLETKKFYKVIVSGNYQTISIYLVDANYYKALLYKVIEIATRGLSVSLNDTWFEKANKYEEMFNAEYENMLLSYKNELNEISYETKTNIKLIELMR